MFSEYCLNFAQIICFKKVAGHSAPHPPQSHMQWRIQGGATGVRPPPKKKKKKKIGSTMGFLIQFFYRNA